MIIEKRTQSSALDHVAKSRVLSLTIDADTALGCCLSLTRNMNFIVEKRSARTARVWRSAGEKTRLKTCVRGGYRRYEQQVAAGACPHLLGFPHSE